MRLKTLLALLGLLASPMAAWGELRVTIEGATVVVKGATPGGDVALLSVWREQLLDGPHTHRTTIEETLPDDDGDGLVEFTPKGVIPLMSIWAVVDEETGEHAIAVPEGFTLRKVTVGTLATGKEAEFGREEGVLRVSRQELQVLIVRPKGGHWRGLVRDGIFRDADLATDRLLTLKLDELEPSEKADPRASALLQGDVVIAIDPRFMAVLEARF